jgi:hypothetical protein
MHPWWSGAAGTGPMLMRSLNRLRLARESLWSNGSRSQHTEPRHELNRP